VARPQDDGALLSCNLAMRNRRSRQDQLETLSECDAVHLFAMLTAIHTVVVSLRIEPC